MNPLETSNETVRSSDSDSATTSDSSSEDARPVNLSQQVTAAELMRRKLQRRGEPRDINDSELPVDIDDEIRRLEVELGNNSSSSSTSSDDSGDDEDDAEGGGEEHTTKKNEYKDRDINEKRGIICMSAVQNERIKQLPSEYLPANKMMERGKKRQRDESNNPTSGLEKVVQEVLLQQYKPAVRHIPFYCRYCTKQFPNAGEFHEHVQTSEYHQVAVRMERKASYCKLCRKQLTSPIQLQEHVKSKPHRQRLQSLQSRQRQPRNRREQRR